MEGEGVISEAYLMDCMDYMKGFPDKHFELAIVDPPYGIGASEKNNQDSKVCKKSATRSKKYGEQSWDDEIPQWEYFEELIRVSVRQIIWGGNYFGLSGGMIYWHKSVTMPTFSTGELAWVSWLTKIDFVDIPWHGMIQNDMKNKENRFHPTQKPVALYKWLLSRYAKPGDKILDTHLGSGSSRIACWDLGFDFYATELDKDYFEAQEKRFADHKAQGTLFDPVELQKEATQGDLF